MSQPPVVQEWQPFFSAFVGAAAALAGLVFVAMSLHPADILRNALTRTRAFAAAFGFLVGVAWALIMLLPARVAGFASYALIVVGFLGFVLLLSLQFRVRKVGLNIRRAVIGDILILVPVPAGVIRLLQPTAEVPYILLAVAATIGLFILFSQSWTLVVHGVMDTPAGASQQDAEQSANKGDNA